MSGLTRGLRIDKFEPSFGSEAERRQFFDELELTEDCTKDGDDVAYVEGNKILSRKMSENEMHGEVRSLRSGRMVCMMCGNDGTGPEYFLKRLVGRLRKRGESR